MRILAAVFVLLIQAVASAETTQSFNDMMFGQPPEADMLCVRGPCSTEAIRPDIDQNAVELAFYIRPVDITRYGNWQISSPQYMFYKDRLVKVSFSIECNHVDSQRCLDETVDRLGREYPLELMSDFSTESNDESALQLRSYAVGHDTRIKIVYQKGQGRWRYPIVMIENHLLMDSMVEEVRAEFRRGQ